MKEQINLLPPQFIQQRSSRLYLARLGTLARRFHVVLVCLLVLIGALYAALYQMEQSLREQALRERPASQTEEAAVAEANEIINLVHTHAQQHPPVTPHLAEVLQRMPASVQLTQLEWDAAKRTITLTGTFDSRAAITTFKTDLEGLTWVSAVDAPLSNFATGIKPTFTFTLTLKSV